MHTNNQIIRPNVVFEPRPMTVTVIANRPRTPSQWSLYYCTADREFLIPRYRPNM